MLGSKNRTIGVVQRELRAAIELKLHTLQEQTIA